MPIFGYIFQIRGFCFNLQRDGGSCIINWRSEEEDKIEEDNLIRALTERNNNNKKKDAERTKIKKCATECDKITDATIVFFVRLLPFYRLARAMHGPVLVHFLLQWCYHSYLFIVFFLLLIRCVCLLFLANRNVEEKTLTYIHIW